MCTDDFTGRFRLYAWDNDGRRSEPLFAVRRKYASELSRFSPIIRLRAIPFSLWSVVSFFVFGNARDDFFPLSYFGNRAVETDEVRSFSFVERDDLYRGRMRREQWGWLILDPVSSISAIPFNSKNLCARPAATITLICRDCGSRALSATYDRKLM